MTLKVTHDIQLGAIQDDNANKVVFSRANGVNKVDVTSYAKSVDGNFSIAATNSKSLSLGDITPPASGLYLEVDGDVDVTLNGTVGPIAVRLGANETVARLFLEASISAVDVLAVSADVVGTFFIWGEPAP